MLMIARAREVQAHEGDLVEPYGSECSHSIDVEQDRGATQLMLILEFLEQVVEKDPDFHDREPCTDPHIVEILKNTHCVLECMIQGRECGEPYFRLSTYPLAEAVARDWAKRFADLFKDAWDRFSPSSVNDHLSGCNKSLVTHMRRFRRILHEHTGEYISAQRALQRIDSNYPGVQEKGNGSEHLDLTTQIPWIKEVPQDGEWWKNNPQIEVFYKDRQKAVLLDYSPGERYEEKMQIYVKGNA